MTKRDETQSLVEQFLSNGGQITKLPYRVPHYQTREKDIARNSKKLDLREEANKLLREARERDRELAAYRKAKAEGQEVKRPSR